MRERRLPGGDWGENAIKVVTFSESYSLATYSAFCFFSNYNPFSATRGVSVEP